MMAGTDFVNTHVYHLKLLIVTGVALELFFFKIYNQI